MQQCTSAVAYMHRQKPAIIHMDIKPENILIKKESHDHVVKVFDFGVSKIYDGGNQEISKEFFKNSL